MGPRREKTAIWNDRMQCLRDLEKVMEKRKALCPPIEPLKIGQNIPVLSDECQKVIMELEVVSRRLTKLEEEYRSL